MICTANVQIDSLDEWVKMAPRMAAVLRSPGKLCSFSYVLFVFLLFYVLDVVSSSSSSSPLLSLVQVPAKLAINLSIHTQHTYDNGVDRTGDRVFRKYSFLHEEREEEKKIFNPQTMLHLEYSLRTEKKTPQHKSTYTINTWHCNRGKHIQLWQAAIRSSAMRRRSQTCSP